MEPAHFSIFCFERKKLNLPGNLKGTKLICFRSTQTQRAIKVAPTPDHLVHRAITRGRRGIDPCSTWNIKEYTCIPLSPGIYILNPVSTGLARNSFRSRSEEHT